MSTAQIHTYMHTCTSQHQTSTPMRTCILKFIQRFREGMVHALLLWTCQNLEVVCQGLVATPRVPCVQRNSRVHLHFVLRVIVPVSTLPCEYAAYGFSRVSVVTPIVVHASVLTLKYRINTRLRFKRRSSKASSKLVFSVCWVNWWDKV